MRVAIAGAGIAGLTAAIALARAGFSVELFERAAALDEVGAGIQLSPNAMSLLDRLGVAPRLTGLVEPEGIEIGLAASGKRLASIPLGQVARSRYGAPYCLIHRRDLQAGLLATARMYPDITLHLHSDLHDVRSTDAGVVFSAGGRPHHSDLLVAADGVHSRLRTGFFGHRGAESLARSAWRATLPTDDAPSSMRRHVTGLWWGADAHLVHYPVDGGRTINIVVISARDTRRSGPPGALFAGGLRSLLDSMTGWTHWPLEWVDMAPAWSKGRVLLIGDAAHAMPPTAAQGGAMAIEDGWTLARCLAARPTDPVAALADYERMRRPRIARVAREAYRNLWVYNLQQPLAAARNLAVSAMLPAMHLARMDWLFRPVI